MTPEEIHLLRRNERDLLLRDKEVNNIIQRRLETGAWIMGSQGFLLRAEDKA